MITVRALFLSLITVTLCFISTSSVFAHPGMTPIESPSALATLLLGLSHALTSSSHLLVILVCAILIKLTRSPQNISIAVFLVALTAGSLGAHLPYTYQIAAGGLLALPLVLAIVLAISTAPSKRKRSYFKASLFTENRTTITLLGLIAAGLVQGFGFAYDYSGTSPTLFGLGNLLSSGLLISVALVLVARVRNLQGPVNTY